MRASRLMLMIALVLATLCCSHPTDNELETLFQRYGNSFETLRRMIMADDGLVRVSYGFYRHAATGKSYDEPGEYLSSDRWNEYRRLFRRLGLENGISRPYARTGPPDQGDIVRFLVSSEGLLWNGTSKGIVFTTEKVTPLVSSLQSAPTAPSYVKYARIGENWYLFYSR